MLVTDAEDRALLGRQVHWPEGNVLLPGNRLDPDSKEPDYNTVVVIEPAAPDTR